MIRAGVLSSLLLVLAMPALPGALVSADEGDTVGLETAYRFDAEGLLSLGAGDSLPVPRGVVSARWYAFRGWTAVVLEGLDPADASALCVGTAAVDPDSGLLAYMSYDPVGEGACDDAGAGEVPLAPPDTGVRTCAEVLVFLTRIPVELGGALVVNLLSFAGDGTGVGLSGRLEEPALRLELDGSYIDCGPSPPLRTPVAATPAPEPTPELTPSPAGVGRLPAADRAPAPVPTARASCPEADRSELQDVYRSRVAPYLMHAPTVDDGAGATIVFLPGGGGGYGTAQRVWQTVFSGGAGFEAYRVIIPYAVDEDLIDQALRTFDIIDEVLWCFGGDPMQVHLGGSSNGGLAAFGLMARAPERFATLVGAPGAFPVQDPSAVDAETWFELLAGRAVLNGVGAFDTEWRVEVIATHNALAGAGIESHFVEFPGQGHVLSPRFDSRALLEFWESHR